MGKTITKKQFVEYVAGFTSKEPLEIQPVVQAVFDAIGEVLVDGNRLEIRNFGVFSVKIRQKRVGRDPNHPEVKIDIPASAVPVFKPGKLMKQRVKEKVKTD